VDNPKLGDRIEGNELLEETVEKVINGWIALVISRLNSRLNQFSQQ